MATSRLRAAVLAGRHRAHPRGAVRRRRRTRRGPRRPRVHDEQITFQDVVPLPRLAPRHPRRAPSPSPAAHRHHHAAAGRHHRLHRPAHRRHQELGLLHLDLPGHRVGFDATELVASWNADTPAGTWIQVEMQGTYNTGGHTPGTSWAAGPTATPTSSAPASNRPGRPLVDDLDRHLLHRRRRQRRAAAGLPAAADPLPGARPGRSPRVVHARRDELQRAGPLHRRAERRAHRLGHRAGRAALLAEHPHRRTTPSTTAAARPGARPRPRRWWSSTGAAARPTRTPPGSTRPTPDPQVNHAARMIYDYQYEGAGNWPFNTAYAASFPGLDAKVTRLHSLDEAERFIKAGIPVVTSQSFLARSWTGRTTAPPGTCSSSSVSPPTATSSSTTRRRRQRRGAQRLPA